MRSFSGFVRDHQAGFIAVLVVDEALALGSPITIVLARQGEAGGLILAHWFPVALNPLLIGELGDFLDIVTNHLQFV
jgi:hypothetical protein